MSTCRVDKSVQLAKGVTDQARDRTKVLTFVRRANIAQLERVLEQATLENSLLKKP